jgi:septal ring factor EnvC (AmiA/AmiB activator)
MDKELLQQSIKDIEESIKISKDNLKKAQQHIEEGEVILEALNNQLAKCTST